MQPLAGRTMAVLGAQWLLPAQLILDLPAVAFSVPDCLEILVVLMHLVRLAVFPLVFGAVGRRACLVLMLARVSF